MTNQSHSRVESQYSPQSCILQPSLVLCLQRNSFLLSRCHRLVQNCRWKFGVSGVDATVATGVVTRLAASETLFVLERTICNMINFRAPILSARATMVCLLLLRRTRKTSTPALIAATWAPSPVRHSRIVRSREPEATSSLSFDIVQHHTCNRGRGNHDNTELMGTHWLLDRSEMCIRRKFCSVCWMIPKERLESREFSYPY